MDERGCQNLVIEMVKQASKEYTRAHKRGDKLTCNMIDKQIRTNTLVISAGFVDAWGLFIKSL